MSNMGNVSKGPSSLRGCPTTASLALAVASGDLRHVRRALRDPRCARTVDPGAPADASGSTALHLAAQRGKRAVLGALVKYGRARSDASDVDGNTALHRAVACANPEAVRTLLVGLPGADPCALNRAGQTPMLMAIDLYRKLMDSADGKDKKKESLAGDLWDCVTLLMTAAKKKKNPDQGESRRSRIGGNDSSVRSALASSKGKKRSSKSSRSPIRAPSPSSYLTTQASKRREEVHERKGKKKTAAMATGMAVTTRPDAEKRTVQKLVQGKSGRGKGKKSEGEGGNGVWWKERWPRTEELGSMEVFEVDEDEDQFPFGFPGF